MSDLEARKSNSPAKSDPFLNQKRKKVEA